MGRIIVPGESLQKGAFARDLNRVVKEHRNGVNRPFVTLVIEPNGTATILSNMDKQTERIRLLSEVVAGLRNMS